MKKKIIYGPLIGLSIFVVIFAALIILPYAFRVKIMKLANEQANQTLDAKVEFDNLYLSFVRNFPNTTVRLENLRIVGLNEFQKDTLIFCQEVNLELNLGSLIFDKFYEIRKLQFTNSRVFAHILPNGKANWKITSKDSLQTTENKIFIFKMKLQKIIIDHADLIYWNEASNIKAEILNINHQTLGNLTAESSLLQTKTSIEILNFWMDHIKYLSNANVDLNADLKANLEKSIFTFSDNSSLINSIPFSIAGWVKMVDGGSDMNLILSAKKADNKAILSMIPTKYYHSFKRMKSVGDVDFHVYIKGLLKNQNRPVFSFDVKSLDGKFQYSNLTKVQPNVKPTLNKLNVDSLAKLTNSTLPN